MNQLTISPKVEEGIRTLSAVVDGIQVTDNVTAMVAGGLVKEISTLSDGVEAQRLEFTKPLNESLKKINAFFKQFSEPLADLDYQIRQKLIVFKNEHKETDNKVGNIHFTTRQMVEIEDESKLPREFLMPDLAKIKKAVATGIQIPGVKVSEEKGVSL
jgi:hypothetical protein